LIIPSSAENSLAINASQVQTISIARDESVRLNNQPVDLELLTDRLIEMKRANPELAVVIRPDRDLAVQKLIDLMDWLRRAEIAKVGIATRIEPK
jgi:biopolymer transport protein ExbD